MPRTMSSLARGTALALSAVTAALGIAAVALVLLPPFSWQAWQYALLTLEFSLFLALVAVLGVGLALLCLRGGRRRAPIVLASINAAALVAALVPPAALWSTARDAGAELSLAEYTAGLATSADRDPTTLTYATVE